MSNSAKRQINDELIKITKRESQIKVLTNEKRTQILC